MEKNMSTKSEEYSVEKKLLSKMWGVARISSVILTTNASNQRKDIDGRRVEALRRKSCSYSIPYV
jgi:hypothetical protein